MGSLFVFETVGELELYLLLIINWPSTDSSEITACDCLFFVYGKR